MTEPRAPALDLGACDREPIHVPGSIQPHGVLLALGEPEATIRQVSANVETLLGRPADELLEGPLSAALGPRAAEVVRAALAHGRLEEVNPIRIDVNGRSFDCILHRHEGAAILELEPAAPPQGERLHQLLRRALAGLQSASTLAELCDGVAAEVRRITGFERVMVYRFDEDGHGAVVSEVRDERLEPYLGLHYPASDIPRQARELYRRNWLRIIPDARYVPAPIVPALRPDTGAPLDLGFAVLRSVSPIHVEYLANMGIRASMSVSLVVRGSLWGLVSCANHGGPRHVPYETRSACEVLGRLASLQLAALEQREAAELRAARLGTEARLAEAMRRGREPLESLFDLPAELLGLVGAEGAAAVCGGRLHACGRVPPAAFVASLSKWLGERSDAGPFATASLADHFPPAARHADVASGLLAISLPGSPRRRLLWFRPELVRTVRWGGDPHKAAELDPGLRLHPRRSFELWKQEVRLRSLRWTAGDLEAADTLRRLAVEVDLERQVERTRRAVRDRDDLVAVVSHDLKNPLGVIGMEASRILGAIEVDGGRSRGVRRSAERIQRSTARMSALIGDLLEVARLESGAEILERRPEELRELVEEALGIMRPLAEAKRLAIAEELRDTATVSADRERIFRVLSNLVGNAIKFTPEGGWIAVRTERLGGELVVTVEDSGPGIPEDQLPHVFDRFWQAQKTKALGAGLGLPIAKGIVEAHGGRIWAESPPGLGARFHFTLPAA